MPLWLPSPHRQRMTLRNVLLAAVWREAGIQARDSARAAGSKTPRRHGHLLRRYAVRAGIDAVNDACFGQFHARGASTTVRSSRDRPFFG